MRDAMPQHLPPQARQHHPHHRRQRLDGGASPSMGAKLGSGATPMVALPLMAGSACAGLMLAGGHPYVLLALPAWLAVAALVAWRWTWLAWLLPGLLPVLGFAPWTGWLTFEELELLVLAIAAGGYASLALAGWRGRAPGLPRRGGNGSSARQRTLAWSGLSKLLLLLFALSLLLAIWRGAEDAGGWRLSWWQGYHEAMNSLRQGKSFFLLLLLLPLWRQAAQREPQSPQRYQWAMALALLGASLAALWERLAFTGLLDFSTDYRTTGLFWEAHVGGAPLDACLALTLPFALAWLWREHRPAAFAAALGLMVLASYAALTSFSRGVYLALPPGALLCLLLMARQGSALPVSAPPPPLRAQSRLGPGLLALGLTAGFGLAAWPLFSGGGYRGLLALAGSALLLLAMPAWRLKPALARGQRLSLLLAAAALAWLGAALAWLLAGQIPKAVYLLDALVLLAGLGLAWRWHGGGVTGRLQLLLLATLLLLSLALAGVVAGHWGGKSALADAWPALLLLALAWLALQLLAPAAVADAPLAGFSWRGRALLWLGCLLTAAALSTFAGGSYMGERMQTGQRDLMGRQLHWQLGLGMLDDAGEWMLGKGTGRFVASYYFSGPKSDQVGDYRMQEQARPPYLSLSSGRHVLGWGELFRVSQRVSAPQGRVLLRAKLRSAADVDLHAEVCEKHLLYSAACVAKALRVKGQPERWQDVEFELGTAPRGMGGPWWLPRLLAFSIAVGSGAERVDIASLRLSDARSEQLLANGHFADGMAHWFSSSDRHHMPWHMKSLPLHILFEQGLLGLALATALLAGALWRCTLGQAREHPLAPPLAGALLGFVVVGLFDSLIDAPRIGFMFFALLALGLGLRGGPAKPCVAHGRPTALAIHARPFLHALPPWPPPLPIPPSLP